MPRFAAIVMFALLMLPLAAPLRAAEPAPIPPGTKAMPWHLVDIWWAIPEPKKIDRFSIDVMLDRPLDPSLNIYVAPLGLAQLNGVPCYGGLQTNSDGKPRRSELGTFQKIGPGAIFSRWKERSLDAVRLADGGYCQSSGSEGDFISVRAKYPWAAGKYTLNLVTTDRQQIGGQTYTWVAMFIYSHAEDQSRYVGSLRFPGDGITMGRSFASFFEIYGPAIPLAKIPSVTVTLDNVRLNDQPADIRRISAQYDRGVPDYADVTAGPGAVKIVVGKPVHRTARHEQLWKHP